MTYVAGRREGVAQGIDGVYSFDPSAAYYRQFSIAATVQYF